MLIVFSTGTKILRGVSPSTGHGYTRHAIARQKRKNSSKLISKLIKLYTSVKLTLQENILEFNH